MADEDVSDLQPESPVEVRRILEDTGEVPPDDEGPPVGEAPPDDEGPPVGEAPPDDEGPPVGEAPPDDEGPPVGEAPEDSGETDEDGSDPESAADEVCRTEGSDLLLCLQTAEAEGTGGGEDGTCDCYSQPVLETFPQLVESNYNSVQAFTLPTNPEFCQRTEDTICSFLEEEASCCCPAEASALTACIFVNRIIVQSPDVFSQCTSSSCSILVEEDSGGFLSGNMLYYMIAALIVSCASSILYYCCCSSRAKERKGRGKVEVNLNMSTQNNTVENRNATFKDEYIKAGGKKRRVSKRVSKKKKKVPRKSKIPGSVGSDSSSSFEWGEFNEDFYQLPQPEEDDESDESSKKGKKKRRSSKREVDESERHETRRRSSRVIIDEEIEERRKSRRRRSKRDESSESSDEDSDDRSRRKRKSKVKIKERRREIEEWNKKEKRKRASKRKSKYSGDIEESMRKARTVLDDLDDTEQDAKVQVTVIHSLQEVIALLEEDKMKLEARQLEVDEERMRLQMDIESSKGTMNKIDEETAKYNTELLRANLNNEVMEHSVERENRKENPLSSGLETMKMENKELAILLEQLKQAKLETEQKLAASEGTRQILRADQEKLERDLVKSKISKVLEHKKLLQERLEVDSGDEMEVETPDDDFDIELGLGDDHLNDLPLGLMPQQHQKNENLRNRMVEVNKTDLDNFSTVTSSVMGGTLNHGANRSSAYSMSQKPMSTLAEERDSNDRSDGSSRDDRRNLRTYSGDSQDSSHSGSYDYKVRDESSTRSSTDHFSDDSVSYSTDKIMLRANLYNGDSSDDQSGGNTYYGY